MTNWTPAQRAAIEDRGGGLLVSAAAGSGKTAVLTERAVRLIADPVRPVDADRLLMKDWKTVHQLLIPHCCQSCPHTSYGPLGIFQGNSSSWWD